MAKAPHDDCEFCGKRDCHWTRHDEAHADVAVWQREARAAGAE